MNSETYSVGIEILVAENAHEMKGALRTALAGYSINLREAGSRKGKAVYVGAVPENKADNLTGLIKNIYAVGQALSVDGILEVNILTKPFDGNPRLKGDEVE